MVWVVVMRLLLGAGAVVPCGEYDGTEEYREEAEAGKAEEEEGDGGEAGDEAEDEGREDDCC